MKEVRPLLPEELEIYNAYYYEYYETIFGIALSRVGDKNIAEVVAQETFVTAWEKYDDFQGSENPAGWLILVAKNKCKQAHRDRKRYLDHRVFGSDVEEIPVEYDFTQFETVIPEIEEKRLLVRYYEEGYTLRELAEEHNLKIGAMKMRLKRARDKIKEIIPKKY